MADSTHPGRIEIHSRVLILTIDAPPVNALSQAVRQTIADAVARAQNNAAIDAMVIRCAGRGFFAGADIKEFGQPPEPPFLPDLVSQIEASKKPVVAAIHGAALGGGLEVALGCHGRIAATSANFGLPEVKLGLIPGAGGTQRLPRLIGVFPALEMMTSGDSITSARASELGLIDAAVAEVDLQSAALAMAREFADGKRVIRRTRERGGATYAETITDEASFASFLARNARKFRHLDAPPAIISAVRFAQGQSFEAALKHEREVFLALREGEQSRALRYRFFAERQAAKIPGLDAKVSPLPVNSVGIIGAGTMGAGIAINFLLAEIPVVLVETNAAALERGQANIRQIIARRVAAKRLSADAGARALSLLHASLDYQDLADADVIIEAAFETMEVKQEIFRRIDAVAKPDAILATNTSYLDIDVIAAGTGRPEYVLGLHFFSPANVMKLLEIVRAAKTSDAVLVTALALAKRIGKTAVVAGVTHGFIGNRMMAVRRREAESMILEGMSPYRIDQLTEAFGMAMGPFRISDLAGLDLGWSAEKSTGASVKERLCELGRCGQKTGAGFYDYDADGKAQVSSLVEKLIADFADERQIPQIEISDAEILQRLLYPMINEGTKLLEEKKAFRASDIDVAWLNGFGWPGWRGGPMYYAEQIGLARIRDWLAVATQSDARFTPSALLVRLADGRGRFDALDQ